VPAKKAAKRGGRSPYEQLRGICLALPQAAEVNFGGHENSPTFRVRDKIFAMFQDDHHGDGRLAVWCKAPPGAQDILVGAQPDRFFKPPYVGPKGWIGVRLDRPVDWEQVADLIEESYRMTAPKRLLKEWDAGI
jgi:predicted DNA-binding protein (MmcQ/YjbR family)